MRAGGKPRVGDGGFRQWSLADVSGQVGYAPRLPRTVASGFTIRDVTVALKSYQTGNAGVNPVSHNVVSVGYRRGFDRVVVTNRAAGFDPSVWEDPLGTGEGFVDRAESVKLTSGSLAGQTASVVITPRGTPHAWLVDGALIVTISGDLSRAQIIQALNSFVPR